MGRPKKLPPKPPPAPGTKASALANGKQYAKQVNTAGHGGQGNQVGRPFKIKDVDALLSAAEDYIEWAATNPLKRAKSSVYEGVPIKYTEDVARPLTKIGFCRYLGISRRTLERFTDPAFRDEEFIDAAQAVYAAFESNLLEGGIAKLYDGGIIARILQLAETVNSHVTAQPVASAVPEEDVPCLIHPDDPDPYCDNPLRFSRRQIDAGVPFPMKVVEHD